MRRVLVPVLGLICLMFFAAPSAVLAAVLLLPSLMARVDDRSHGHAITRAVLLFGVAAGYPTLDALWQTGDRMPDAITLAIDVRTLAWCWSAQAGAWLLGQVLPVLVASFRRRESHSHEAVLQQRQAALESEWE